MSVTVLPLANRIIRQYADFPDVDMQFASKADFETALVGPRFPDGWMAYCVAERKWYYADKVGSVAVEFGAGGGASDFGDLGGAARDNADLLAELEALEDADTQIIDAAPTDYNTLNKIATKLAAVEAIIADGGSDGNSIVDTVAELLAVFETYPEGTDIATVLAGKVNTSDIVNNLSQVVAGKVLDAAQGKVLNDLITALTTTVGGKEPAITAGTTAQYLRGDKSLSTFASDALAAAPAETTTTIGGLINGSTAKTTPVDADMFPLMDSAASNVMKKLSWANVKAILKTWIETSTTVFSLFTATKALFGTTTSKNAHVVIGASTSTLANENIAWGAPYTGSEADAEWKETTGYRKFLKRNSATDEYLFMGANPALAGSNPCIALLAPDGSWARGPELKENTTLSSAVITAITGATYTSNRATITPAGGGIFYMGQIYDDGTYTYQAIANNSVRRY
jgi:hypothetical protein